MRIIAKCEVNKSDNFIEVDTNHQYNKLCLEWRFFGAVLIMSHPQQQYLSPFMTNSLAIRQEIQRFESVHPSIYAIYDLIELVPDPLLAQQIREHVVCIEDSFVNSQEWTLSRSVPDIRLGIVGSLSSGKSALVHRYLTGSYMMEESPEGGRFKKEVVVDGQSYLLLIRDEGGPPELQFTAWVDAVIFVFSLENETSFNAIYNYYAKMAQYRNIQEIPIILVGTQDAINESNPRIIEDSRARKLANDLKRCAYYETCATYGLNVERVFQDACQKICQGRGGSSRPTTPNHFVQRSYSGYVPSPTNGYVPALPGAPTPHSPGGNSYQAQSPHHMSSHTHQNSFASKEGPRHTQSATSVIINPVAVEDFRSRVQGVASERMQGVLGGGGISGVIHAMSSRAETGEKTDRGERNTMNSSGSGSGSEGNSKFLIPNNGENKENRELPTPSSTPTSVRKNRRRSNLFTPSGKNKAEEKRVVGAAATKDAGEVGSGRSIPIRQGYLYKKSSKSFSKDWKKKYVTLCDDARLTYHPTLHDYMENVHGKEISLQYVTVKVPGQAPRGSAVRTVPTMGNGGLASNNGHVNNGLTGDKVTLTGYEALKEASGGEEATGDGKHSGDTPNVKKRHRRMKSAGVKGKGEADVEEDAFEFVIVSLDNKQWQFEAGSAEDRDEWVAAIEQQILSSLQGNESSKSKDRSTGGVLSDAASITRLRSDVRGNTRCVDCDSPHPDWASLNLGVLVCIECSGIHRNLGSHISRVRSLDLDEWPPGHVAVMTGIGNYIANTIWEARVPPGFRKPGPDSPREEKERYIKAKYEGKEWLAPLQGNVSAAQYLVEAICRCDMAEVSHALAHCVMEDVNSTVSNRDARTPLHLAAALGNLPIAQLLIWCNSDVNAVDHEGRTCVYHARSSGAMDVVSLLLTAGCPDLAPGGTLPRRRGSGQGGHGRSKEIASSVL